MNFVEEATKFLSIKSLTKDGNEAIVNYLIPLLENIGAKVVVQQVSHSLSNHSKKQYNIIGILGDDLVDVTTKKGLLLLSHVDTATPIIESKWTKLENDPWNPKVIDDKIYGVGAANAKLDFIAKLAACKQFMNEDLAQPIYIAATCGAESILQGSKYLMQSRIVNPKSVIVGHPTNLKIVNNHKSRLVFGLKISYVNVEKDTQEFNTRIKIITKGKAQIAANPPDSNSAIFKILNILRKLSQSGIPLKLFSISSESEMNRVSDVAEVGIIIPDLELDLFRMNFRKILAEYPENTFELEFGATGSSGVKFLPEETMSALFRIVDTIQEEEEQLQVEKDDNFKIAFSTLNLHTISQNDNSITLKLHFALLPKHSSKEFIKDLETNFKAKVNQISLNYPKLSFEFKRDIFTPRLFTESNNTFINSLLGAMSRSGLKPELDTLSMCTEGAYFSEKNIDTIVFGAGNEEGNSLESDEFNLIPQIDSATRFYSQVIESFCKRGV